MQASSFYTPPLSKTNKIMIISVVAFFLLGAILKTQGIQLAFLMGLQSDSFFSGHLYQIITYPWINFSLLGVIFECLLIWFLGGELEMVWGRRTYLEFLGASILSAALVFLILSTSFFPTAPPLIGISGVCYAICMAYAVLYPERRLMFMLIFPLAAKWFCLIMIGILLYMGLFDAYGQSSFAHLAAMGGGFLFLKLKSQKARTGRWFGSFKTKKSQHLYIIKDDDKGPKPPTYH
jgi:membrane associated rhomboid family serine protease